MNISISQEEAERRQQALEDEIEEKRKAAKLGAMEAACEGDVVGADQSVEKTGPPPSYESTAELPQKEKLSEQFATEMKY